MIITLFKTLLLPPALQLGLAAVALLLWHRYRRTAVLLFCLAWLSLLLLSLPSVAASLFKWLEKPYLEQRISQQPAAEAVVVLGGGRLRNLPEYSGDQVGYHALWRLRYAAKLARDLDLPVVVSGGTVYPYEQLTEAQLAKAVLQDELGIESVWLEGGSRNTWQNAQNTATLLADKGLGRILLVTHAYHMRRAEYAFNQAGISLIEPAPTGFFSTDTGGWWNDWLPQAYALHRSRIALHEYLGLLFYRLRQ